MYGLEGNKLYIGDTMCTINLSFLYTKSTKSMIKCTVVEQSAEGYIDLNIVNVETSIHKNLKTIILSPSNIRRRAHKQCSWS